MSDLLTEVDEAMKQERIEKLWQQYGGFVIGFIAVIILGTAANAGHKAWKKSQNIKQTNLYLDALYQSDSTPKELQDIAPKLKDGLRGIVKLHSAGLALKQGDTVAALDMYRNIKDDSSLDPTVLYVAKFMCLNLDKEMPVDKKRQQYQSLANDTENPWRFHAHLDAALMEANVVQDYTQARKHLAAILKESLVAETLKQKAKSLDILYSAKETSS